ncbi:MAG: transposase [Planctomycetia bacterium]|nr:transposase [Planctomycetia bacterium]
MYRIELPFDNNHAERSIRPAVIMRKNSYGNRSDAAKRIKTSKTNLFPMEPLF